MTDVVVDSSVIAKWILPEPDSAQAQRVLTDVAGQGKRLIALDLAFIEVANAIWKRLRQKKITASEADGFLDALRQAPIEPFPAADLVKPAFAIAVRFDRAIYDALFVALAEKLQLPGVTADEPLCNAVRPAFSRIVLLQDWP
jgi:predicted nucleic acid-binding protein